MVIKNRPEVAAVLQYPDGTGQRLPFYFENKTLKIIIANITTGDYEYKNIC
jgi:hypothetical protein